MLFVLKSLFPTRLFSLTSITYLIASWIFPTALQASIWFTHQSSQISHWYQYLPSQPKSQGTFASPDAKLTSTVLLIFMEEVFWRAGAEVTTNEVIAEVAARSICKGCALIYIYKK